VLLISFLIACNTQTGRVEPAGSAASADADNTARNKRDRDSTTPTPSDQAENKQDLEISANIRKALIADDSLSMNAHNIKIITSSGVVTLRGPVESLQEKAAIEAEVKHVSGVQSVNNMLEVQAGP